MSDGGLHSFWSSLQRAEQRMEAEAKATERDLYRTVYGYKSRVMRLRSALAKSGPIAFQTVSRKLEGIDLKVIWPILFSAVRDMALYYGGSVVLGTAIGAGLGSLAFGFGAIPGAAIGAEAGSVVGDWVLIYLGLQMLAEGLVNTIPPALRLYVQGFRLAWGPVDSDRPDARYSADYHQGEDMAAHRFADGHVLMIIAILMAMVAYLTRGKSEEALMQAVRKSERLGTKMADWLADNRERLLKEESLKPKVVERAPSQEKKPEELTRKPRVADGSKTPEASNAPKMDADSSGPKVVQGAGSKVDMMGHKIYDPGYSPLSTNPSAQYRFSDPTFRQTGGDVYFGENLSTSYYEVRQNVTGKSLFVGDVHVDNILDLTDENVLNQMNIDSSRLLARVDNPLEQKAVYGYTNEIANQAYDAGYNGILYPSTRGPGNAVVLFGGRYDPSLISPVVDFPLQ